MPKVQFRTLDPRAVPPRNAYGTDAGWDLTAIETRAIAAGPVQYIKTGIAVDVPPGFFLRIVGRSSTIRKKNLMVTEGIIDAGYQGELLVGVLLLPGVDHWGVNVSAGDTLAQMLIHRVEPVEWHQVEKFALSERGLSGWGSSGNAGDGYPYRGDDHV